MKNNINNMNQYKVYCINEDKGVIIKGFNTDNKKEIKNEVKSYLSKIYPGKQLDENFVITTNPQNYGLDPKKHSSWINAKKEMQRESVVRHMTDKIYESIVESGYLTEKVNEKNNVPLKEGKKVEKKVTTKKNVNEGTVKQPQQFGISDEDIKKLVAQNINEMLLGIKKKA